MQNTMNKRVTKVLNYCHHNRILGLKKERKIVQRLIEQIYIYIYIDYNHPEDTCPNIISMSSQAEANMV